MHCGIILASYSNSKKLQRLKTEISSSTMLDARSPKLVSLDENQDVSRSMLPLEAVGENLFFVSSGLWWWLAFLVSQPHNFSIIFTLPSLLSVFCLPLITHMIAFRACSQPQNVLPLHNQNTFNPSQHLRKS